MQHLELDKSEYAIYPHLLWATLCVTTASSFKPLNLNGLH